MSRACSSRLSPPPRSRRTSPSATSRLTVLVTPGRQSPTASATSPMRGPLPGRLGDPAQRLEPGQRQAVLAVQRRVDAPGDAVVHLHDAQPRLGRAGRGTGQGGGVPRDAARRRVLRPVHALHRPRIRAQALRVRASSPVAVAPLPTGDRHQAARRCRRARPQRRPGRPRGRDRRRCGCTGSRARPPAARTAAVDAGVVADERRRSVLARRRRAGTVSSRRDRAVGGRRCRGRARRRCRAAGRSPVLAGQEAGARHGHRSAPAPTARLDGPSLPAAPARRRRAEPRCCGAEPRAPPWRRRGCPRCRPAAPAAVVSGRRRCEARSRASSCRRGGRRGDRRAVLLGGPGEAPVLELVDVRGARAVAGRCTPAGRRSSRPRRRRRCAGRRWRPGASVASSSPAGVAGGRQPHGVGRGAGRHLDDEPARAAARARA